MRDGVPPPASSSCPHSARNSTSPSPSPRTADQGRTWKQGPPVEAAPAATAAKPIRIGYARCSTAQQESQSQLDALRPLCKRIFSEKISTCVKTRPKLQGALRLAYDIREAAPDQEVILTAH
ncbi:recombinase family protein [Streptomyces sp. ICBB 8177]|uniref:recombinase family protein n=1 Tax=Streptomyces sp. ICBB 8177 TaxID=563922 RepID=UPI0018EEC84B